MTKAIYFDMDGTIANLYGFANWVDALENYDPTPYFDAEPLFPLRALARRLAALQRKGYHIGIVSWLSKNSTSEYDFAVAYGKKRWLHQHMPSINWDEIVIVPYGTPKSEVVKYPDGILFDDEEKNRNNWKGCAFNEKVIIEVLEDLK